MATCGIWLSKNTLWTALIDDDARLLETSKVGRTDEERWDLLCRLDGGYETDCSLVLTDAHARIDTLANLALERHMTVWLTPWRILDALRILTGMKTGPPRRVALLLARLLHSPLFRTSLRPLTRDPRQLSML